MKKRKIIICEDEAIIAIDIAKILEKADYTNVTLTYSAGSLIEASKQNPPDIIIADINLRDKKNGIEAVKEIRSTGNTVGVIYLSGNSSQYKSFIEEDNLTAVMSKPFMKHDLIQVVDRLSQIMYNKDFKYGNRHS